MNPAFPEHRLYSVLAALQVGMILIGTFAIRLATMESLRGTYAPAPAMAVWIRDWGYLFLLVPAAWIIFSIRAARKEDADQRLTLRIGIGLAVTALVGFLFWWLFNLSTMQSNKMHLMM